MGGGKNTTQKNVPKKARDYTEDKTEAVAGAGGGFDKGAVDSCLISFKARIPLIVSSVDIGTDFVLTPMGSTDTGLQLISGGQKIGEYRGNRLGQLNRCIADGYTYHGKIAKVQHSDDGTIADCTISGAAPK